MHSNTLTYAQSGVDRDTREKAKKFGLFEKGLPKGAIKTPYCTLLPSNQNRNYYYNLSTDGVGTKVLLAELAGKHDTIGIDAVAMVANDAIRCGAAPLDIVDAIDINHSEPELLSQIIGGIQAGAELAGSRIVGGETADVPLLINGLGNNPYHINCSCYAEVEKKRIITATKCKPGNAVIGLRSSGLHSNGLSLARRALFKEWGGAYAPFDVPEGLDKPIVLEALTPTALYSKQFLLVAKKFEILAAANITGDAYGKLKKISEYSPIGFALDNFSPQPIFSLIQSAAQKRGGRITDEEMFRTFNMGWGFALVANKGDAAGICREFGKLKVHAEIIGKATGKKGAVEIEREGKKLVL
ncbi:MAG: phosphoribosylformylglycinamidine cyclo-ligase [Candidatus Micrarchaeia archaeon]|jgi:phosphoribosylformylglycinamidine cyclo-ligase